MNSPMLTTIENGGDDVSQDIFSVFRNMIFFLLSFVFQAFVPVYLYTLYCSPLFPSSLPGRCK